MTPDPSTAAEAEPLRALARDLTVGAVVTVVDPAVATAAERLVGAAVPAQWAGWPEGETTDGAVADLAWRIDPATVAVALRIWVGLGTLRTTAVLVTATDGSATVALGDVDAATGGPTRLWAGSMLHHDDDDGAPVVLRQEGRRLVAVTWTPVATVSW